MGDGPEEDDPSGEPCCPLVPSVAEALEEESSEAPARPAPGNPDVDPGDECSICLSVLYRPVSPSACRHVFCMLCLYQAGLRSRCCPLCRAPFKDGVNIHKLEAVPGADERLAAKYPERYALQK